MNSLLFFIFLPLTVFASELEPFPSNLSKTEPPPSPEQSVQQAVQPGRPLTEDEIRLNHFKDCVDQTHIIKLQGIALAGQARFEESAKLFNIARDAYTACNEFIPTDLLSYFFLPQSFRLAKRDYYADFADLFFQFALIQQDDENQNPNLGPVALDLSIGAMQQALEKMDLACEAWFDESCNTRKQSYYTVLADAYRLRKNLDEALALFEKANEFRPDDPANLSFWGLALYEKGLKEEAYQKWQTALIKDPKAPAAEMMKEFKK